MVLGTSWANPEGILCFGVGFGVLGEGGVGREIAADRSGSRRIAAYRSGVLVPPRTPLSILVTK